MTLMMNNLARLGKFCYLNMKTTLIEISKEFKQEKPFVLSGK